MSDKNLIPYKELIKMFIDGKLTAKEFETEYLALFKREKNCFKKREFIALDNLFYWVDAYCEDPELRDENDCDEKKLLEEAQKTLNLLEAF